MNRTTIVKLSWRDGIVCGFWIFYCTAVLFQILQKSPGPGDLDFLANKFMMLLMLAGLGCLGLFASIAWSAKLSAISGLFAILGFAATGLSLCFMQLMFW